MTAFSFSPYWYTYQLKVVANSLEREKIQTFLDKLEHWDEINRMAFNREKCKVVQLGRENKSHKMEET